MTTFYTSDTHFGHANIIIYSGRPWLDTEAMDQGLVERWNSVVSEGDTVYHLGDVALGAKKIWPVSFLNGDITLLAGNHDDCWEGSRKYKSEATERYLEAGFKEVITSGIKLDHELSDGRLVTLSHLPYVGNEHDGRKFTGWRPIDTGRVNLCGHVHEAWKVYGRSVNVGVDVWDWYPVSEDELIKTINWYFPA